MNEILERTKSDTPDNERVIRGMESYDNIDLWRLQRDELHRVSEKLLDAKEDYNATIAGIREKLTKIELEVEQGITLEASRLTEKNHPLSNQQKRDAEKLRRLEEDPDYRKFKKEEEVTTMEYNVRERRISLDVKKHRDNAEMIKMRIWMEISNNFAVGRVD